MGPLRIELRTSREIAALLGTAYGIAGLALWLSPVGAWLSGGACAALAHCAWRSVGRHASRSIPDAVVALELYDDCTAAVRTADGRWLRVAIVGSTFTSSVFAVLNLRAEGKRGLRSVLVSRDCIDRDAFRRLRVWLRWYCVGKLAATEEAQGRLLERL
jgi:toxin CptA